VTQETGAEGDTGYAMGKQSEAAAPQALATFSGREAPQVPQETAVEATASGSGARQQAPVGTGKDEEDEGSAEETGEEMREGNQSTQAAMIFGGKQDPKVTQEEEYPEAGAYTRPLFGSR